MVRSNNRGGGRGGGGNRRNSGGGGRGAGSRRNSGGGRGNNKSSPARGRVSGVYIFLWVLYVMCMVVYNIWYMMGWKKTLLYHGFARMICIYKYFTHLMLLTNFINTCTFLHRIKVLVVEENDTVAEEEEVQEVEERAEEEEEDAAKVEEKRNKSQLPQKNWMRQWMIIG